VWEQHQELQTSSVVAAAVELVAAVVTSADAALCASASFLLQLQKHM
jgi:hypothetical protein